MTEPKLYAIARIEQGNLNRGYKVVFDDDEQTAKTYSTYDQALFRVIRYFASLGTDR